MCITFHAPPQHQILGRALNFAPALAVNLVGFSEKPTINRGNMPTTETSSSITDQLRALIRLQHIDSRIDQVEKLRGDLPEEIRDLEDEKAGLQTRIEKANEEAKQAEVQRRKLQMDITESEGLIKKYEEQQLNVRNNREYDALTKEIEAQRQRIQQAETDIEAFTERDAANEQIIEQAEERLAELDDILKEKRGELDQVVEETEKEQESFVALREEAAEAIEPRYLKAYERLRNRLRDGRAVVPIERGAAGSFMVPPQRQVEVRQRNRIVVCEHTGRVIVDDELFNETIEEMDV
jgi:predicted  nucleic acid-binding Zn-ribbon protein